MTTLRPPRPGLMNHPNTRPNFSFCTFRFCEFAPCKNGMRPRIVPGRPDKTYKHDGWQGWCRWLGTGNTKRSTVRFEDKYPLPYTRSCPTPRPSL